MFITASAGDSGVYRCLVRDDCGVVISEAGILTVYPTGTADGNGDGHTNALDIQPLINYLIGPTSVDADLCAYELTGDGIVDDDDVEPFVVRLLGWDR